MAYRQKGRKHMSGQYDDLLRSTVEKVKEYADLRLQLLKLEIMEKLAKGVAKLSVILIAVLFAFLTILFLGLMLGFYLNELLNSTYLGFAIITGCFAILFLGVLFAGSHIIETPLINTIIKQTQANEEEED